MYYFIVNEHGGSGKSVRCWDTVKTILENKHIEYKLYVPECAGHAEVLASQISEKQDDDIRIVVVGGDGTVNEVLNGIRSFERVKLGLIPSGSGNDFSRGLSVPRHDPKKALELILNAGSGKLIDVGFVKTGGKYRLFGISSGFGLDAVVGTGINTSKIKVVLNKIHLGRLSYAVLTVVNLFKMKTHHVKISFDGGPLEEFSKLIFVAAMNFKAEGGGVPMAPDSKGDDGLLSVCMAAGVPKWKTFLLFPFLIMGLHGKFKGFMLRNCRTMDIYSDSATVLHTDGEFVAKTGNVHFECLEKKLRVLV